MSIGRSIVSVIVGYLIFALSAFALFQISGQPPHQAAPAPFIFGSIIFGAMFALLGGYVAAWLAKRRPLAHCFAGAALLASGRAARRERLPLRDISQQSRNQRSRHASRVAALLACSSTKHRDLEDSPVWQMRLTLWLMSGANSGIRQRNDRIQELRLPPDINFLLQIIRKPDQLRLAMGRAIHQHSGGPA